MSKNFVGDAAEISSVFSDDPGTLAVRRGEIQARSQALGHLASRAKASSSVFRDETSREEGRKQRQNILSLNAYDRHKLLVNEYFLYYPGSTKELKRDESRDKTDYDVVKNNHRFLWDDVEDSELTWEQKLAKKYCQKLFKEYCICDLSKYKEGKVAMRWRTENELKVGKGQFVCGGRKCEERELLRTWEVNFAYVEEMEKKNALVKVRLCPECSIKLNYKHKRKDVTKKLKKKREKRSKKKRKRSRSESDEDSGKDSSKNPRKEKELEKKASEIWSAPVQHEEEKSREEEFSEYLDELFM